MLEATEHNIALANCDGGGVAVRPQPGQTKFSLKSKDMLMTENGYILTMCTFSTTPQFCSSNILNRGPRPRYVHVIEYYNQRYD
jgi:hypothetical protein